MIIKKETNSGIYNKNNASGFIIHKKNNCEYVRLYLAPGSEIEKHALPFPVTFYVIKGSPDAVVEEKEYNTSEEDLLEIENGVQRGWKNNSASPAEILVIKHL